jgi:hypothetical protein
MIRGATLSAGNAPRLAPRPFTALAACARPGLGFVIGGLTLAEAAALGIMPGPDALLIHLRAEAVNVMCRRLTLARRSAVPTRRQWPNTPPARALCPQTARLDCASRLTHAHTRSPRSPGDDPDMAAPSPALSPPRAAFFLAARPHAHGRAPSQCRSAGRPNGPANRSPSPSARVRSEPTGTTVPQRAHRNPEKGGLADPRFWHQPVLNERREATTLVGFHRADYDFVPFSNHGLAELHLRKLG